MKQDMLQMGNRLRKVREEIFRETRQVFAERCHLIENHLGKLERGELFINIKTLIKICDATGTSSDYILYGESENKNLTVRENIDFFLDRSSKEELRMYFKIVSSIVEIKEK